MIELNLYLVQFTAIAAELGLIAITDGLAKYSSANTMDTMIITNIKFTKTSFPSFVTVTKFCIKVPIN